jgi:hypothetical protein
MPHEWRLTKLTCDLGDLTLPSQLTHLSTPLPGQYNQAGEVVGPLNAAHETYVSQLAAGLPDLLSLVINNGVYEGKEKVCSARIVTEFVWTLHTLWSGASY